MVIIKLSFVHLFSDSDIELDATFILEDTRLKLIG